MPDNKPKLSTKQVEPTRDDVLYRTLSAPATVRVHKRLESARQNTQLDKSGLVRLAVRMMINEYYDGKGKWTFPPTMRSDMLAASHQEYMDIDLPE